MHGAAAAVPTDMQVVGGTASTGSQNANIQVSIVLRMALAMKHHDTRVNKS